MGVEDEILPAQVEARCPVSEGPGGEAGPSVRQQVQGHVTGTCTGQEETPEPTRHPFGVIGSKLELELQHFCRDKSPDMIERAHSNKYLGKSLRHRDRGQSGAVLNVILSQGS